MARPDAEVLQRTRAGARAAYLDHLRGEGRRITEPTTRRRSSGARAHARRHARGRRVIAQATLRSGRWLGRADVLLRVERPSGSAPGPTRSWTPSSRARPRPARCCSSASTRTCWWRDPGRPARAHARREPGDDFEPEPSASMTFSPITGWCGGGSRRRSTAPPSAAHLSRAGAALRHLPLVAALRPQRRARRPSVPRGRDLAAPDRRAGSRGVDTLRRSRAAAAARRRPRRGAQESYERVREQARVQLEGRRAGAPCYELLPVAEGRASAGCPRLAGRCLPRSRGRSLRRHGRARIPVRLGHGDRPASPSTQRAGRSTGRGAGGVRGLDRPGHGALGALPTCTSITSRPTSRRRSSA